MVPTLFGPRRVFAEISVMQYFEYRPLNFHFFIIDIKSPRRRIARFAGTITCSVGCHHISNDKSYPNPPTARNA